MPEEFLGRNAMNVQPGAIDARARVNVEQELITQHIIEVVRLY
jgi:hypothetical protein